MPGGAGGHEVSRIAVKVVPDTGGFAEKLKAFLEKAEKSNKLTIEIDLDTKKAEAELKRLAKDLRVKLNVEVDSKGVRAKLDSLGKNVTAKVKTNVDDAKAKIELDLLARDRKVNIKTDVDKGFLSRITGVIGKGLSLLSSAASEVTGTVSKGLSTVSDGASSVSSSLGSAGSKMQALGSIATVALYGILIPAAAGAIVAVGALIGALALVALPVAFVGIGIAFAAMSKKGGALAKSLRKNFLDVKKTALSVVSGAVQPMLRALNQQLPQINHWVASLKGPLKSAFLASSKYVGTFAKAIEGFTSNTLTGVVSALNNPGLKPAVDGLQKLMDKMGTAIGTFFDTLANFGPGFGATLTALGNALMLITPALAGMLGAFATISPDLINRIGSGITEILHQLSDPQVLEGIQLLANLSFDAIILAIKLIAQGLIFIARNYEAFKAATKATIAFVEAAWIAFKSFLSSLWKGIQSVTSSVWSAIVSAIVASAYSIVSNVHTAVSGLTGFLHGAWASIKSAATSAFSSIASGATSKFHAIGSAASSVVSSIKGYFSGLAGYINAVVSSIRSAVGTITNLASKAKNAISSINPFGAPPESPDYSGYRPPPPPGSAPMPMGSFQGDLDAMQSSASRLNSSALKSAKKFDPNGLRASTAELAQKIYEITINAAPNVPTEQSLIKALNYADALYA